MKAWGASAAEIAKVEGTGKRDGAAGNTFEVEPENWNALQLFLDLQSQWRVVERSFAKKDRRIFLAVETGLDLSALPAVAEWLGIKPDRRIFASLRTLESEALAIFARQRERRLSAL